jgi:hypothetical protein
MRRGILVALMALLPTAAGAQLSVEFDAVSISVTGATPGGAVAVVTVSREARGGVNHVTRSADLLTADLADGSGKHTFKSDIVKRSVWAVIDVTTGHGLVASPSGAGISRASDEIPGVKVDSTGAASLFVDNAHAVDLTVVRPKVGAWNGRASDGGPADKDEVSDGLLEVDVT